MKPAAAAFGAGVLVAALWFRGRVAALTASSTSSAGPARASAGVGSSGGGKDGGGAFSLHGKNTVVTGGASGIGLEISKLYARQGATVHVVDVNVDVATEVARSINADVGRTAVFAHHCDVSSQASVTSVFAAITAEHGVINVLVNNAAVASVGTVQQATEADMERLFRINVQGVFFCSQAVVNGLLAAGQGGSIINLGSIASLIGLRDRFVYSMSKGAVLTMTYSLATDYVKKGIRCNAICPGRVHTPFVDGFLKKHYPGREAAKFKELSEYQPMGRMGQPTEVAALALYLASDEAAFVTGAAYPIDGGVTCNMG